MMTIESQFKNAVFNMADKVSILTLEDPEKAIEIFKELLDEIKRVKYPCHSIGKYLSNSYGVT